MTESAPANGARDARAALPPATRMGAVRLSVADLDRSRRWYERAVGLRPLEQGTDRLALGADGEPLVEFEADPGARP